MTMAVTIRFLRTLSSLRLAVTVAALLLAIATTLAFAAGTKAGSLDKMFGMRGEVTAQLGTAPSGLSPESYAKGVAVQSDGKIVVAGAASNAADNTLDFAVTRYNIDGSPDVTFGAGGTGTAELTDFGGQATGRDVVMQPDGKIVVAGDACDSSGANCRFALARYNTDGAPDSSFGNGGKLTTSFGGTNERGYALALETLGKIVVAGISTGTVFSQFAIAQYLPDGTLDPSFGVGGEVTTAFGAPQTGAGAHDVAVQADGKIMAAGWAQISTGAMSFAFARYNTDGSLDTSFGTGGQTAFPVPFPGGVGEENDGVHAVAIGSFGQIVALGSVFSSADSRWGWGLMQLNSDGSNNTNFGGGLVTTDFAALCNTFNQFGRDLVITGASVVAVGSACGQFGLVRYLADGSIDSSFGEVTTTFFKGGGADADGVAIQPDGKILAAGGANGPKTNGEEFAVARYLAA
jgi:uncharacterized delta-60 repeat protein